MVPFSPQLRNWYSDAGGYPDYYYEDFLNVQTAISKSIIREFNANVMLPEVYINVSSHIFHSSMNQLSNSMLFFSATPTHRTTMIRYCKRWSSFCR